MGKRLTELQIWTLLNSPNASDASLAELIDAPLPTVHNMRWVLRKSPWSCKIDYQPCRWCGETLTLRVRSRNAHAYHAHCKPLARAEIQRSIDATRDLRKDVVDRFHQWHHDAQAKTLAQARNSGAKWTDEEDEIVLAWIDRPIMETANELGRTYMATSARRKNLKRRGITE